MNHFIKSRKLRCNETKRFRTKSTTRTFSASGGVIIFITMMILCEKCTCLPKPITRYWPWWWWPWCWCPWWSSARSAPASQSRSLGIGSFYHHQCQFWHALLVFKLSEAFFIISLYAHQPGHIWSLMYHPSNLESAKKSKILATFWEKNIFLFREGLLEEKKTSPFFYCSN